MNTFNKSLELDLYPLHQAGTALIMALVVLLILTLIGVSALNTTTLEAKMAGNAQDTTRAIQAAESGTSRATITPGNFNADPNATPPNLSFSFGSVGSAQVKTTFIDYSSPITNSGFSIAKHDGANFEQVSEGKGIAGGKRVVHQGTQQITLKQ